VALRLRQQGIIPVRPLAGGFMAWRELGYPVEAGSEGIPRSSLLGGSER